MIRLTYVQTLTLSAKISIQSTKSTIRSPKKSTFKYAVLLAVCLYVQEERRKKRAHSVTDHVTSQYARTHTHTHMYTHTAHAHIHTPAGALGSAQTMKAPVMAPDCVPAPASSSSARPPTGEITPREWLPSGYCRNEGTSLRVRFHRESVR